MPERTARASPAAIWVRLASKAVGFGVWIVTLTTAPLDRGSPRIFVLRGDFFEITLGARLFPVQHALAALQDRVHRSESSTGAFSSLHEPLFTLVGLEIGAVMKPLRAREDACRDHAADAARS